MAAGGAATVLAAGGRAKDPAGEFSDIPVSQIVLPPPDARVVPTACDYCVVGCGYKIYSWPVGREGGPAAAENAIGVDYPVPALGGDWISPNMQNIVEIDGAPHHVLVIPDSDTEVVNRGGDHSVRGGPLAQKLYSPDKPTRDRLQHPQLRVDGEFVDISWDEAIELAGDVSRYVLDKYGEMAWGMKQFSYHYYENTYALTKLARKSVATPVWAPHDKPAAGADTPGLSDAGINDFIAAYEDWRDADVIFISGTTLYETKSILFNEWVAPGQATLIVVNPRRDYTAAYAESRGGLHLQVNPGTDTVLNNAIAREIIRRRWEDADFIAERTVSDADLAEESGWRRNMFGMTFQAYKDFLFGDDTYTVASAERITGVLSQKIRRAAELMARPRAGGTRPKTSIMLEKGNYWAHNYPNTASVAALGLVVGAGGRPGQMQSRAGGHQRGMISAAGYPKDKSPDSYMGNAIELNVDRWVADGNVRFMYVVGTTWVTAMGASQNLAAQVRRLSRETGPSVTRADAFDAAGKLNVGRVKDILKAKADAGGMIVILQEIYPNIMSEFADFMLPAATWGEEDFARMQGERRLRIYSKVMDPPSEAKPDWWIVAQIAKRMGFSGYDWSASNEVFEEASERSKGTVHDYAELVNMAKSQGKRGHEFLRELGTTGIQCPIKLEDGKLVGTKHLHQEGFGTASGKAIFPRGDWNDVKDFQEREGPKGDELWVTNMRVNEHWQSQFDDIRIPYRWERFPVNFLEVNPEDAGSRGIESGDWVRIENDAVATQNGGRYAAGFDAVAYVTNMVPKGVTCSYFIHKQGDLDMAANSVTSGQTDPINNRYRFKLGKGRVTRTGESEYKRTMSFAPRNLA